MTSRRFSRIPVRPAIATLLLAMAMPAAAPAAAQRPDHGPHRAHRGFPGEAGPGGHPVPFLGLLGLSEDQEDAWREGTEAFREEQKPLAEELDRLHEELRATLDSESPNPTVVGELELELRDRRAALRAAHEAAMDQLAESILDEAQLRLWQQLKERREGMRERFESEGRPQGPRVHHRGRGPRDV